MPGSGGGRGMPGGGGGFPPFGPTANQKEVRVTRAEGTVTGVCEKLYPQAAGFSGFTRQGGVIALHKRLRDKGCGSLFGAGLIYPASCSTTNKLAVKPNRTQQPCHSRPFELFSGTSWLFPDVVYHTETAHPRPAEAASTIAVVPIRAWHPAATPRQA